MIGAFLAPYFELADRLAAPMTVLTYPSLARLAAAFGDAAGLPEDQARFTLCLVLSYPLAALQSRLPRHAAAAATTSSSSTDDDDGCALRHASHAFVGVSMLQFALGTMWIHAALAALGGWLLLRFSPDPDRAHVHVTAFILTYCSASHAYRMHADYGGWALDFTGIMMMLCVKLMSLAFNVADGRAGPGQPGADTAAGARGEDGVAGGGRVATGADGVTVLAHRPPVYRSRLAFALPPTTTTAAATVGSSGGGGGFPITFLQYLGYIFCFPCVTAGPTMEMRTYLDGVRGAHFEGVGAAAAREPRAAGKGGSGEGEGEGAAAAKKKEGVIARRAAAARRGAALAALGRFCTGLACCGVYMAVNGAYPKSLLALPLADDDDSGGAGAGPGGGVERGALATLWSTLARNLLLMVGVRFKYYFAWKVSEGAAILAGFGFEGFEEEEEEEEEGEHAGPGARCIGFGGVSQMDILGFELAQSVRDASRCWNCGTQAWLERYVYLRLPARPSPLVPMVGTYLVSAAWHGFYPGYYLFFVSMPLAMAVGRGLRRKVRPRFLGGGAALKAVYDVACVVCTALAANYLAIPFQVLSLDKGLFAWRQLYFAGHVVLLALYAALLVLPTPRPAAAAKKQAPLPAAKKTD